MLDDNEKAYAFKQLLYSMDYSQLPFEKRQELADKWLAELKGAITDNDYANGKTL